MEGATEGASAVRSRGCSGPSAVLATGASWKVGRAYPAIHLVQVRNPITV